MKRIILLFAIMLAFVSCNKEDSIIGSWEVVSSTNEYDFPAGTVFSFKKESLKITYADLREEIDCRYKREGSIIHVDLGYDFDLIEFVIVKLSGSDMELQFAPDDEMVRRLAALYGARRADAFRRRWEELRSKGQDAVVEAEKERFCRRMYSLSPFVKTFKERIAFRVNRRLGRSGHVFEGRFFSGLVDEASARRMVSLYIDCNPVRAGLAKDPSGYAWCGYAAARDARSAYCERCRRGYEATFGMGWADADRAMREAFRARLPANARELLERGEIALSPSQIVHLRVPEISFGAYVSRHADFARRALGRLARGFPAASARSLARLVAMVDWDAA